jgi:hypothetical protein
MTISPGPGLGFRGAISGWLRPTATIALGRNDRESGFAERAAGHGAHDAHGLAPGASPGWRQTIALGRNDRESGFEEWSRARGS